VTSDARCRLPWPQLQALEDELLAEHYETSARRADMRRLTLVVCAVLVLTALCAYLSLLVRIDALVGLVRSTLSLGAHVVLGMLVLTLLSAHGLWWALSPISGAQPRIHTLRSSSRAAAIDASMAAQRAAGHSELSPAGSTESSQSISAGGSSPSHVSPVHSPNPSVVYAPKGDGGAASSSVVHEQSRPRPASLGGRPASLGDKPFDASPPTVRSVSWKLDENVVAQHRESSKPRRERSSRARSVSSEDCIMDRIEDSIDNLHHQHCKLASSRRTSSSIFNLEHDTPAAPPAPSPTPPHLRPRRPADVPMIADYAREHAACIAMAADAVPRAQTEAPPAPAASPPAAPPSSTPPNAALPAKAAVQPYDAAGSSAAGATGSSSSSTVSSEPAPAAAARLAGLLPRVRADDERSTLHPPAGGAQPHHPSGAARPGVRVAEASRAGGASRGSNGSWKGNGSGGGGGASTAGGQWTLDELIDALDAPDAYERFYPVRRTTAESHSMTCRVQDCLD
jgi:uncharacterized membrane protein YgcG